MQPAQAADSRRMGNGLLAESPSLQGRERAGCVAGGWSDRPEPGRHAVRARGCKDPRKRPQRALGPVCVFRRGAHRKGALSSSEPLTERKKGTVGCRDGPVLPRDPVSSTTGVQTVLRERGQGRWATGTEQGVTRRGHFPARGHTTWGVSPGRSSGSELRGAAPGGPASTQEACFKNKTKPAIHAGGLQKARPVPGTQGRSPPDPPTPSQAQGGCRLPFPAQCPSRKRLQACPPRWDRRGGARISNGGRIPGKGQSRGWELAGWPGEVPPRAGERAQAAAHTGTAVPSSGRAAPGRVE